MFSTALASLTVGLLAPVVAHAQDECGPAEQGAVRCTQTGNSYPGGIAYTSPAVDPTQDPRLDPTVPVYDLTVIVDPGVAIERAGGPGVTLFGLNGGDVSLVSNGAITTSGDYAPGVYAVAQAGGNVSVTVNTISTNGFGSHGVVAAGDAVDVTVNGAITTGDYFSRAVTVQAFDGGATVTNNGSISTLTGGGVGIYAYASNGVTVSGSGTIETRGGSASGIKVHGFNGATIITAGSIATAGNYSRGVEARSWSDVTLNLGDVTTAGRIAGGIEAFTFQNGSGPLDADLKVTVDTVTTTGDYSHGINVFSSNNGVLTIDAGTVTLNGEGSVGILADSYTADMTITVDTVVTTGAGGLYSGPFGIYATSDTGDISITSADRVSTQGLNATGVFAATAGDVRIDVNDVSTQGDNAVALMAIGDNVNVTIGGDVSTAGGSADAVNVYSFYGTARVVNNGAIMTTGVKSNGIVADGGDGGVVISGTGSITTRGDFSTAILARSGYGSVSIAAAAVTTAGAGAGGIDAYGAGGVMVNAAAVTTTGTAAFGIAAGGSGSVTVNAGQIRTSGAGANGVDVASFGGDVYVNVGSVRTSGVGSTAIRASGFGGGSNVRVSGAVGADDGSGVRMFAGGVGGAGNIGLGDPALDGIARLAVTVGGSVSGGDDAVLIDSVRGAIVDNAGVITGGSGYALRITGAPATITNSGDINGRLLLTAGADTLTNSGRLMLTGTSDFGAGADTLVNSGAIRLAAAATAQTVSVAGLEALVNTGLIDLRNGVVGDRLAFAGAAYTGSGDATLGLDVAFADGTATADQLILGSAAGATSLALKMTGVPTLFAPVTLVDVGAASDPNAFELAPGARDLGLISIGLRYVTESTTYQLISAPSAAVYRQARLGEALTSVWNRSADAVSARFSSSRDAGWASPADTGTARLWVQALSETNTRKDRRDLNYGGLTQPDVNLGYRQDASGAQFGLDVIGRASEDGVVVGLTAGYLDSATRFLAGGDRFDVEAFNVGVYASVRSGPFFVNGLAKYDYNSIDRRSSVAGLDRDDASGALGGKVEAGVRLGSSRFFAEPLISLAYSRTSLDDFDVGASAFDYDAFQGLRGKAGLRLGGRTDIGGSAVAFYAAGAAVKEFEGRDRLRFSSGGQVVMLRGDGMDTFGQATLGLNVTTPSGVSGFIEGHGEFGSQYDGGGIRAGVRVRF